MAKKCLFLLVFLPLAAGLKWGAEGILVAFLMGVLVTILLISRHSLKNSEKKKHLEKLLIAPSMQFGTASGKVQPDHFERILPPALPKASPLQPSNPPVDLMPRSSIPGQSSGSGNVSFVSNQKISMPLGTETGVLQSIVEPKTPPNRRDDVVSAIRPPSAKNLQWIPPGTVARVNNRSVPGPIYVSDRPLGWGGEPSAICKNLPTDSNFTGIEELPYYPGYESLSPSQRGFYLDWLSRDRRDFLPENLPTGYLFLFFYGVERRMLVDKDLDPALWHEVSELLRIYGLTRKSRSVASYFGDFLHFTSYSAGQEGYANVCQKLLDMQGKRISETALTLALANHFRSNQPAGWALAHLVAMNLDDSRRSVVTERTGDAFRSMFRKKFEAAYPGGMVLKASKRDTTVRYQTGNATLSPYHSNYGHTFEIKVPGVMGIKTQFRGLSSIWNQCIEDLSGYSRAVARIATSTSVSNMDLLKAHLALPKELRDGNPHPLAATFQQALLSCPSSDGMFFVPVSAIAGLLGIDSRVILTQRQSEDVTDLVSSLGYTLSPHPGILSLPLVWSQEIAIAPCASGENITAELGGLLRLLYLGVLVASADGVVDEAELQVFHRSSGITDEFAKAQIAATEAALVRDTQVAAKHLQKIAKSVPSADCPLVFKLLVHIACSDEVLSSDENRMLRKIAKALRLPDSALDDILSEESAFMTVTVARGKSQTGGEAIPRPPKVAAPAFSLDMERIAALTAETAEVVSILSRALAEEAHEDPEQDLPPLVSAQSADSATLPDWAATLDQRYQAALIKILSSESDRPIDLALIASCHHLMIDDLVDGINAWSDESLGDFLIEIRTGDQAFLSRELIPCP